MIAASSSFNDTFFGAPSVNFISVSDAINIISVKLSKYKPVENLCDARFLMRKFKWLYRFFAHQNCSKVEKIVKNE